ncbi:hypothetical protein CDV31_002482 [Fusarium ambrosium]|uniref:Uncharacterized protein n=1 Tax=Fusarium ambrosium TaxID=131363 RepID=A0A428UWX0_9HYPO|nr:hypothetical protein CDV31_002482 [Fusarium ambrosium]
MARRDSSISLEEGPVPVERHSPQAHHSGDKVFDSAKPPLLLIHPQELHTPTTIREESPEDGCPLLPSQPSLPSSPTVTAPMDVFLVYEDDHEKMRVGGVDPVKKAARVKQLRSEPAATSLGTSSWQHASDDEDVGLSLSDEARLHSHDKRPQTPVLQPIAGRATTESPYVMVDLIPSEPLEAEDGPLEMPGSNIQSMSPCEALEKLGTSNGIDGGDIRRQFRSGRRHDSVPGRIRGRTRVRKSRRDLKEKREK